MRHKVPVVLGQRLDLRNGVKKDGTRIVSITMETGESYTGKMFIDATYEGDLMAKAGVSYHVGREANSTYGETLNGVQVKNATHHQFVKKIDPYVKPGDPTSGLLPRVHAGPPGTDGEGDRRVQAYNYRLCATDRPENRRPWPKPANYDEKQYELLLRNFEAGDHRVSVEPDPHAQPQDRREQQLRLLDRRHRHQLRLSRRRLRPREKIIREHIDYQKGLMWTLANHPRVPEKVRQQFRTWGLAKDEFTDTDNWPHQLYVREARRMIGDYVMTEQNCRGRRVAEDSVGLAAYTMDSHNVQRYVTTDGARPQRGGRAGRRISSLSDLLSLRSCRSRRNARTCSCRSVCRRRTSPTARSAWSRCSWSSASRRPRRPLSPSTARSTCRRWITPSCGRDCSRTSRCSTGPGRSEPAGIDSKTLAGIVIDDEDAERRGFEHVSSANMPFVNSGYRHDGNERRGEQWARYRPDLPREGEYEVRISYSPNANRATNVPVTIVSRGRP